MSVTDYSEDDRQTLLTVARESIEHYLATGRQLTLDIEQYSEPLQQQRATFITLKKNGQLRGCIGHLQASSPLIIDVATNSLSAAISDYRFSTVTLEELDSLTISVSILTQPKALHVDTESDLLNQLSPGIDGVILQYQSHQATFLPSVWESLSTPEEFIKQLKLKAQLAADFWSTSMEFKVYRTVSFSE